MSLHAAIETFVRGFAFTRSFTKPFVAERVGPLWVMRDGPGVRADYRAQEWIASATPPAEVVKIVKAKASGRHAICHICDIDDDDGPIRAEYKRLGCRLRTTEPMFTHDLRRVPRFESSAKIERVRAQDVADRLAKIAGSRQIPPKYLQLGDAAPIRQYIALDGDEIAGWVRSIEVGKTTWVSNLHVVPTHRRKGIASALMATMLRDDRAAGITQSALLASHAGAKLYPRLGYREIGLLLLYSPKK